MIVGMTPYTPSISNLDGSYSSEMKMGTATNYSASTGSTPSTLIGATYANGLPSSYSPVRPQQGVPRQNVISTGIPSSQLAPGVLPAKVSSPTASRQFFGRIQSRLGSEI